MVVSLSMMTSLPTHVFQGFTVATLSFSGALRALCVICPAFSGRLGTSRLVLVRQVRITLAWKGFSVVGVGAGAALMAVVRDLLYSGSVCLASSRGPS